ncbi:alpha/beta fold hydrolase [Prauserella flavalba]|uniref:Alpha/beta hydrolase n=1 Tax=Prauserella flavalba TaxID=1477506 RepID=A0A318LRS5_9PSEU|nr:alpha/beta hydrolase [Prauserella flavalba]PXY36104.1 alpha/beta hydrolase [Prauserella flavalba]
MTSIYRTPAGREAIAAWCHERFDRWPAAHRRETTVAHGATTHLVTAGRGEHTVLLVPGTNFGAAAYLPLATALARRCRVLVADLPGQPGLSCGERIPRAGRLGWYGRWLTELIEQTVRGPVTVLGHSLGAAIALACGSSLVRHQVLVSPGGLTRLRITPAVLVASTGWVLRRTPAASARLLRLMHGPAHTPRPELVEWMTLVARHVRSTADPGETAVAGRDVPRTVVVGGSDVFLPGRTLAPAVRGTLGVDLDIVPSAGHLVVDEHPERLAELVAAAQEPGT